jgi:hypothetical protein
LLSNVQPRSGLRIRCDQEIYPLVKKACINFAFWLRLNMEFPIRVVVYIKKDYQIKTMHTKELVYSTFLGPYDKSLEPYIRVASGDYQELTSERGEENAIAAILISVARQIIHYQQWIEDREFNEQEAEEEAEKLVDDYYEWTE